MLALLVNGKQNQILVFGVVKKIQNLFHGNM